MHPGLQLHGKRLARRTGFTLIELMVVIAIIALLMALTASGIFQYVESQKQTNTEAGMRAVDKALNQAVDAVLRAAETWPRPMAPSPIRS
jgi:prepilin-type N-terminal cleavage/methylation domain-containing protein